jgi:hypothetical protein
MIYSMLFYAILPLRFMPVRAAWILDYGPAYKDRRSECGI